jgi:hypothetical protein
MRQHMFKDPPLLAEQVPGLPASLTSLVHQMLAKKPSDRPRMVEVADLLDRLLAESESLQGGPHALSGVNITGRRRALSQSGQGALDPFAKTLGSSGPDPFASTLSEPRLPGKSRSDSGVGAVAPAISQSSLDQAKPASSALPISLTLGQRRGRAAIFAAAVGAALLCIGAVFLLRPARTVRTTAAALPPVARPEPSQSASGAASASPVAGGAEAPPQKATVASASPTGSEPETKDSRAKKKRGGSKKQPQDGKDKRPGATSSGQEKHGNEQEVWR